MESFRHRKIKIDTSGYIKIIGIVNSNPEIFDKILYQITKEVKCKDTTNLERQERLKVKPFIHPYRFLKIQNLKLMKKKRILRFHPKL